MNGENRMQTNEMKIEFESRSCNESFARVAVAAFMTQLNPTLEEVADVKTALSEAVTNAIVHGYEMRSGQLPFVAESAGMNFACLFRMRAEALKILKKRWSRCLLRSRTVSDPVWGLLLWRLLWTASRWSPR